jgi:hypothetical protein
MAISLRLLDRPASQARRPRTERKPHQARGSNRGRPRRQPRTRRRHRTSLYDAGATVYATARHPETITDDRLIPVQLDVDDRQRRRGAVRRCGDVSIDVNNVGILRAPHRWQMAPPGSSGRDGDNPLRSDAGSAPLRADPAGHRWRPGHHGVAPSFIAMPHGATHSVLRNQLGRRACLVRRIGFELCRWPSGPARWWPTTATGGHLRRRSTGRFHRVQEPAFYDAGSRGCSRHIRTG